ncbi:Translocation protein S62 [Rhizina undulata]
MAAQGQPVQAPPAPPPEALAVANFLKSQDLKSRTCILNGQRKDLFKVKRALRALESEAYKKAQSKNPALPKIESRNQAIIAFNLLPRGALALRVSKIDSSHDQHGKPVKRVKGLWTVKIEQQQEIKDELYYCWFYEPRTWVQTFMAIGVIVVLLLIVMFPLWPPILRLGVWYLSMGMLGLIGLFILMSIFRLILFVVTSFAVPPGLWLYPNLFEDVGFFDSFRPLWAWHKVKKSKKSSKKVVAPTTTLKNEKSAAPATPSEAEASESAYVAPARTIVPPKPTVEDG